MRALAYLCLLLGSVSAAAADSFQTALQLYQAGSPRLALARVVRDQSPQPDPVAQLNPAAWYDWESLRLTLLSETQQAAEILARAKLYPNSAPRDFQQKALGHQVWALLELKQSVAARIALARLLWQFDLNPADHAWARRLVIRSYLLEHKPAEAYRAMLRYQQDFQPLPKEVATEFVQGLLAEDAVTEATTWLAQLDADNPTLLALKMQAGLVGPEAASVLARAALQKQPNGAAYIAIVAQAAEMLKDDRRQIEALEQALNSAENAAGDAGQMQKLWQAYQREAERLGNLAQALRGDDMAWLALAAANTDDQLGARALYAYSVQHGTSSTVREEAQAQLYAGLVAAQLDGVAVRLFNVAPWRAERLSEVDIERLLTQASAELPDAASRGLYYTAGRLQEERRHALVAADYFAQAVLKSNMRQPDVLALQALQRARINLELAGFKEEADAFYRRAIAQKVSPAKPATKNAKRRK
jgi:hypothetical protein